MRTRIIIVSLWKYLKGDNVNEKIKLNTSSYCNYNKAFTVYDQLRQPNGLRELLQIFKQTENDMF